MYKRQTAGHESPELFHAISDEVVRRRLGDFNAQGLSNTAWAFATAGHEAPELFAAIAVEVVRRRLGGFNEQELSNTAWAFATAGHASHELFNAISAEAVRRRLGGFNEQDLSNTAWAFAKAGHASSESSSIATTASACCASDAGSSRPRKTSSVKGIRLAQAAPFPTRADQQIGT